MADDCLVFLFITYVFRELRSSFVCIFSFKMTQTWQARDFDVAVVWPKIL